MAARVTTLAKHAFRSGSVAAFSTSEVAELDGSRLPPLGVDEAETPAGNLLSVLDQGPSTVEQWRLLGALWCLGNGTGGVKPPSVTPDAASSPLPEPPSISKSGEANDGELEREALWLLAETPLPIAPFIDVVFDAPRREALWHTISEAVLDSARPRAQRIVLAAALAESLGDEGAERAAHVFATTADPTIASVLEPLAVSSSALSGEMAIARSPAKTILLAVTGLLFLGSVWRVFARFVLGARQRARLTATRTGVELQQTFEMLGKPIRERERFLPLADLATIQRETRFRNAWLYAGLVALAAGTYVGSGLLIDAFRAPGGSPSLAGLGIAVIAVGVLVDFLLFRLSVVRGKAFRVLLSPRQGGKIVLLGTSPERADLWLQRVSKLWDWERGTKSA